MTRPDKRKREPGTRKKDAEMYRNARAFRRRALLPPVKEVWRFAAFPLRI
jgi:hypothetical protein